MQDKNSSKIKSLILVMVSLTIFGCRGKLAPGHYEGNLSWRNYSDTEIPVSIEVTYEPHQNKLKPKIGHVEISDQRGNRITSILLSLSMNHFSLEIPSIYSRPFSLKKQGSPSNE